MRGCLAVAAVVLLTASGCAALHPPGAASGTRVNSPSPSAATYIQLSAPSAGVLWALVDYRDLYRSSDQGSTWERHRVPDALGVRPVMSFIDDHEGWLLAPSSPATQCQEAPAEVWHTVDAGTTWQRLAAAGIASAQCKNGIWFDDAEHGLISAWDDMHAATIYRTSDGGITWSAASLVPNPPNYQSDTGGAGWRVAWMKSFGADLYLAASGTPYIFKSSDGGATWGWITKTPTLAVAMVTEERWLDFSTPSQAMESVNGGQAFHPYASDFFTSDLSGAQFAFPEANTGFAVADGVLQRTTDGGAHWTRLALPGVPTTLTPSPSHAPVDVPMPSDAVLSAPSADVVWALVASQYLFRSTDRGMTWQKRSWAGYPGGGGRPLISFVDDTTGWALFPGVPATQCAQQGGQLWRTTDGAATWRNVSDLGYGQVAPSGLGFEQCKESLYFADAQHGFVGADDPTGDTIYRTADGGLTWTSARLPNPPGFTTGAGQLPLIAIKGFDATVLAYAPPYVFQSIDGGATWAYLATEPNQTLGNLVFVSRLRWLVIQNDQTASETLDGGQTWHMFTTDYADAAPVRTVFAFADSMVGYGTVRGDLHGTIDGGAHWKMIKNSWP